MVIRRLKMHKPPVTSNSTPITYYYPDKQEIMTAGINKLISELNDYLQTTNHQCRLTYDATRKTVYIHHGKIISSLCVGNECLRFLDGMRSMAWVAGLE